ncbi:DASH complex subunit Ask1-domain-containing protein, partial [Radiomyces spectabilis]|uniref:DASH complex subunit Ask1-domain-containing protein n=1 Tax=Radiomyces spectabilis TaxID=64574 RepID=UPI00221F0E12
MAFTDEDANAELEKLQQNITLTLQAIDQNFAKCNQIVSSSILPAVDKFAEASKGVWNGSKLWLYFFQSLDDGHGLTRTDDEIMGSNRPPLGASTIATTPGDRTTTDLRGRSPWQRLNNEMSLEAVSDTSSLLPSMTRHRALSPTLSHSDHKLLGKVLRRQFHEHACTPAPLSVSDAFSTVQRACSESSSSSRTGDPTDQNGLSPPRTIPFGISPSRLIGTPQRDAAKIITEDLLAAAGAGSPPSSSSNTGSARMMDHAEHRSNKSTTLWDGSALSKADDEGREHFEQFMKNRQERLQQMDPEEELQAVYGRFVSPYQATTPMYRKATTPMVSTPTVKRVFESYNQDLRVSKRPQHDDDSWHNVSRSVTNSESDERRRAPPQDDDFDLPSFNQPSFSQLSLPDIPSEPGDVAYEFSQALPSHRAIATPGMSENGSLRSGESTPSMMSMVSGMSGQIPVRFSLKYFPSSFQSPPGSTQLTRLHSIFADRPGQVLTMEDILTIVEDANPPYNEQNLIVLLDMLKRKKFIRKTSQGWSIRR